jgi:ornithine cyclodeaminase/alanine dehydrogenase-like protein (mu-crystallin family)
LSVTEADTIGVIGTGGQTKTQVEAVRSVRPIKRVKVYSRRPEPREAFAAELAEELGMEVTPVASAQECITDSDIVITVTGSRDPVFDGSWLKAGAHINAIGATTPGRVEIDETAIGRCDVVVVESVAQAKVECGELILAEERGTFLWSKAVEMRHLVAGVAGRRPSPEAITLFDGLGVALEDMAAAGHVLRKAKEQGMGQELPIKSLPRGSRRIR